MNEPQLLPAWQFQVKMGFILMKTSRGDWNFQLIPFKECNLFIFFNFPIWLLSGLGPISVQIGSFLSDYSTDYPFMTCIITRLVHSTQPEECGVRRSSGEQKEDGAENTTQSQTIIHKNCLEAILQFHYCWEEGAIGFKSTTRDCNCSTPPSGCILPCYSALPGPDQWRALCLRTSLRADQS